MNYLVNLQGFARLVDSGLEMHQFVNVKVRCVQNKSIEYNADTYKFEYAIVVCPTLSNPQNGRVNQRGNKPGDRASYTCNSGYELVGQSTRICQNNGQWSGDAPTCDSKAIVSCLYSVFAIYHANFPIHDSTVSKLTRSTKCPSTSARKQTRR